MTGRPRAGPSQWLSTAIPWLAGALIAVGAALRCVTWLGNRSLWIDEATVALGLLSKPVSALWGSHPFGQMSPPIWLALVRGSGALFGPTEAALRLPTLVLAIGYLPAVWLLARRIAGPGAALVALALSAFSPALVGYAVELKPYGADPLIAVTMLAVGLRVNTNETVTMSTGLGWGAVLGFLAWASNPAIIVMVAVVAGVVVGGRPKRGRPTEMAGRLVMAGTALAIFTIGYRGHFRLEPWLASYLDVFWDDRFLDPGAPRLAHRCWVGLRELVSPVFFGRGGDLIPGLLLIPIGLGLWSIRRPGPASTVVMMVVPFVVTAALAVARRYPLATRLDLFAAPLTTVWLATGLVSLLDGKHRWLRSLPLVFVALLPIRSAVSQSLDPIGGRAHARPVLDEMSRLRRPGEVVYVLARAAPEWLFYTTDWAAPDLARIDLVERESRYPDGRAFAGGVPRLAPVTPIGDDLRYQYRGGEEIFGQHSGFSARPGGSGRGALDPNWAAIERDRILRDRPTCLWLVVLHGAAQEREALRAALTERGYRSWRELSVSSSRVERGCRVGE